MRNYKTVCIRQEKSQINTAKQVEENFVDKFNKNKNWIRGEKSG